MDYTNEIDINTGTTANKLENPLEIVWEIHGLVFQQTLLKDHVS